jgi:signal peptidase I
VPKEIIDEPVSDVAPPEDSTTSGDTHRKPHSRRRGLIEWGAIVVVAVLVSFLMRAYVMQTFRVPSLSMAPTFEIGDRIMVSKLSLDFGSIHRGDILVFKAPPAAFVACSDNDPTDFVKRVIGLPGETISLSKTGHVYIDGKEIHETWLIASNQGVTYPAASPVKGPFNLYHPYKIPADHYFMMGDNRSDSCDSRYWGTVARSAIVGRAFVRIWPLSRFGFL